MQRLVILGLLATTVGCAAMPTAAVSGMAQVAGMSAPAKPAYDYYPMGEDLRWVYEDGPLNSPLPRKRRAVWFLDVRRGDSGVAMVGVQMRNQDRAGQVIQNTEGVYFAPQQDDTVGPRHILLKYPLLIGTGWDIVTTPEQTVKGKVVGIEQVTVPAGTYSRCFKVQLTSAKNGQPEKAYAIRWVAQGVGLVKQHNLAADGTVSSISQLRQFAAGMAPTAAEVDTTRDLFARHHFKEFDVNRDGYLSPYEVGPPDLYEKADRDHDGRLTIEEFLASDMYRVPITRQLQQASREYWSLDDDLDMQLTEREALQQPLMYMPRKLTAKDLAAVDQDENGKLGYREFHVLYRRLWKEAIDNSGKPPRLPKS
jgi:Ca2+-binding EF-hand superfamily protein